MKKITLTANMLVAFNVTMTNPSIVKINKLILVNMLSLIITWQAHAQPNELDPGVIRHINVSIIKNIFTAAIKGNKMFDSALYQTTYSDYSNDGFRFRYTPGFGYLPTDQLEIKTEISPLTYPDNSFKLYTTRITDKSDNEYFKPIDGVYLIGINNRKQIKYISGAFLKHKISQDFSFAKDNPLSYIPYLKIKYYDLDIIDLKYTGKKEGASYIYECSSFEPGTEKYIIKFNPATPEKTFQAYFAKSNYKKPATNRKVLSQGQRENYIMNEVMKNIFSYRMSSIPDLLAFTDNEWNLTTLNLPFDSLLPDYDEILEMSITKKKGMNCNHISNDDFKQYGNKNDKCRLEIYSIVKFERVVMSPYLNKDTKQGDTIVQEDEHRWFHAYEKYVEPIENFLVAYDTTSRDVYFISGNFHLSKALNLYYQDWIANLQNKGVGWRRGNEGSFSYFNKHYLLDRLYAYQLKDGIIQNVIKDDNTELVAEAISINRGREIPIIIHINYDYPEAVIVTKKP